MDNPPVEVRISPVVTPVISPVLLMVIPPNPTLVVRLLVTQVAVPFMVSEWHAPGFPFIVTIWPTAMVTSSPASGIALVDQVPGVFHAPEPTLTGLSAKL